MCGIIGYVGNRNAVDVILKGLKTLEYRGYDSAGLSVLAGNEIVCLKNKGRIEVLKQSAEKCGLFANVGIGHTRWATHGKPSDKNAHPHFDCTKRFSIVHNGIIENYSELKTELENTGHQFVSDTDSEVIAHLIESLFDGEMRSTLLKLQKKMRGSYALAVLDRENPQQIAVMRKDSPLLIGLGKGENFIASDISALLEYTDQFYVLDDGELALICQDEVAVFDSNGNKAEKQPFVASWNAEEIGKAGFEDFMLKEIFEQPDAIRKTLNEYLKDNRVVLPFYFSGEELDCIKRITIVACGTASYAGKVGEYILEELTDLPTKVEVGSEYRYKHSIVDEGNLVIVLSQSGETADTLASMRQALKNRAKVIGVTNVRGSTVSRELQNVIHTIAGPEIAVASTKAFVTQLISLYLIGLYLADKKGKISKEKYESCIQALRSLPVKVEEILAQLNDIKQIADALSHSENMFFIGRLTDYPIALEGSHKLKEISYIHAEAYEAGELKHGALALLREGIPVICLSTIESIYEKMKSNIKEVQTRNATVVNLKCETLPSVDGANFELVIPTIADLFKPVLAVVPLQLLAYHTAKARGCDVDKPRNLAKSVTVE